MLYIVYILLSFAVNIIRIVGLNGDVTYVKQHMSRNRSTAIQIVYMGIGCLTVQRVNQQM